MLPRGKSIFFQVFRGYSVLTLSNCFVTLKVWKESLLNFDYGNLGQLVKRKFRVCLSCLQQPLQLTITDIILWKMTRWIDFSCYQISPSMPSIPKNPKNPKVKTWIWTSLLRNVATHRYDSLLKTRSHFSLNQEKYSKV